MAIEDNKEISDEPRAGNVVISPPEPADDGDDGDDGGERQAAKPDRSNESGLAPERPQSQRPAKAGGRTERRRLFDTTEHLSRQVAEIPTTLKQMQAQFDARIEEIRRERAAPTAQQQSGPGAPTGPLDSRISTLTNALEAELSAINNHDPRTGRYDLKRYNQIQVELQEARSEQWFRKFMKERGVDIDKQPAPPERQQTREERAYEVDLIQRRNTVVGEFPWIAEQGERGDRYRAALKNTIMAKRAVYGRDDIHIDREAAAEVERAFGLTPRRAADPARARRYENVNDGRRQQNGQRRAVQVPAEMLQGHGLPQEALTRAIFRDEE